MKKKPERTEVLRMVMRTITVIEGDSVFDL
jgi:hypothetical protein